MPVEFLQLRVPYRKVMIGLLLTVIPISLAGLYTIAQSNRSLRNVIGAHLATIAQSSASEISVFVHNCVQQAGLMASDSAVDDAVIAANRAYEGKDDAAIADRARAIEKTWSAAAGDKAASEMLASRASRQLRRMREMNPHFLRVTVTDQYGGTVAATHKTVDYWQADEEFWQNIHSKGRGAVSLTDIQYDEVTKSNYIGVGIPILDPASGKFLGALDALVDISAIFPIVNRANVGGSGQVQLVRDDGTIIGAPEISLPMKQKSEEFRAVQDAVKDIAIRRAGYVQTEISGGAYLIGYADTGLKHDYRALGSVVLAIQEAKEAFAPVRIVERMLAFMALLGLATVTFLAAYFSLHRKVQYTDIAQPSEPQSAQKNG